MAAAYDCDEGWIAAVRQRRQALLQRLAMGCASALVFSPLLGWDLAVAWVVAYFSIQVLDLWVFGPINSGRATSLGPFRTVAANVMLFANAAAFGALSLPLWIMGGAMGGVCAAILLTSGAIYSLINSAGSRSVLAWTLSPHFIYLALTPVFMIREGGSSAFVAAVSVAILVFAAYCIGTWNRLNQARVAESAARVDSEQRRVAAERLMASRSAFLAAVGHDLRTPIGAILTGAAELERSAVDSSARAHAALIGQAGVMMKALLDDLLDHAKLEAGRMTVDATAFNLRDLLAQTLRFWQAEAAAKGLKLRVVGASSAPAWVEGDPVRLRQVLNNLISNGLKFTAEGSVCLCVRSWEEEPGAYGLLIDLQDTGPGMGRDQLARLFTPFDQTEDGVSARHGGTGLGLSISRELVRLMDGRLTVRSALGKGSTFTLALTLPKAGAQAEAAAILSRPADRDPITRPLANTPPFEALPPAPQPGPEPVAECPAQPASEEASEGGERPLRVLVVDDHEINRRAIQLILTPLGADIATAADGVAALKAAETDSYDVIFMDVRMPELDGRETTRRLRASAGPNRDVPVIAVTADTAEEDIAACMAAGMSYFVSKPLTPATLLGALQHVLEAGKEDRETAAA